VIKIIIQIITALKKKHDRNEDGWYCLMTSFNNILFDTLVILACASPRPAIILVDRF
jgi:hypothetical protein